MTELSRKKKWQRNVMNWNYSERNGQNAKQQKKKKEKLQTEVKPIEDSSQYEEGNSPHSMRAMTSDHLV